MNSSVTNGQAATGCHGWDLIQAQDILSEIADSQRFLEIIEALLRETIIEVDPKITLLLSCYQSSDIPCKIQSAHNLIESVRKSLP
jgi:hypothetical protein